jgi:Tfp pilus assembly protein PilX
VPASLPTDLLLALPSQLLGVAVAVVLAVWLVNAITGLFRELSAAWGADRTNRRAVDTQRVQELSEALSRAREAHANESKWYEKYNSCREEAANWRKRALLAEYNAALIAKFMDSDIPEAVGAAWAHFKAVQEAEASVHDALPSKETP